MSLGLALADTGRRTGADEVTLAVGLTLAAGARIDVSATGSQPGAASRPSPQSKKASLAAVKTRVGSLAARLTVAGKDVHPIHAKFAAPESASDADVPVVAIEHVFVVRW